MTTGSVLDIAARVRTFIETELLSRDLGPRFSDDSPLLEGIIDSAALMQLIMFIEDEFAVEIDEGDITPNHFRSVSEIERFVSSKIGGA